MSICVLWTKTRLLGLRRQSQAGAMSVCSVEKDQTPGIQGESQNFPSTFSLKIYAQFFLYILLYNIKTVINKTQSIIYCRNAMLNR